MQAKHQAIAIGCLLILLSVGLVESGTSAVRPDAIPEEPLKGRELFLSKGCVKCHAVRGDGGRIGPDLGKGFFARSLTQMAAPMWNHAPGMGGRRRGEKGVFTLPHHWRKRRKDRSEPG